MALTEKLKAIANAIRSKTNKSEKLTLEQMASEVSGIYSPKAEEVRKVTIDENGTIVVNPSEGSDVMKEVEVATRVSGDGYDFTTIGYTKEESGEINSFNTNGIRVAKEIMDGWDPNKTDYNCGFERRDDIVYFPIVDCNNVINAARMFQYCVNLRKIKLNMPNVIYCGNICYRSGVEDVELTIPNGKNIAGLAYYGNLKKLNLTLIKVNKDDKLATSLNTIAYGCGLLTGGENFIINDNREDVLVTDLYYAFRECFNLKTINFVIDLSKLGTTGNPNQITAAAFNNCQELQYIRIKNWGKYNLQFSNSSKLSAESIHYLIQNAMSLEEGATARTLTLNATAKTNWQNSEYYAEDLAVLEDKGITIA